MGTSQPCTARRCNAASTCDGCIVLRKPAKAVREGWAEAAAALAATDGESLLMGEFGNAGDGELNW